LDISLLRTFLELSRVRHFGQAAERLHITQSTVSARIKLLEERLGVRLFERRRNDIQLTPAGHRLQPHAEILVREWSRARQAVALDAGYSMLLAVGCQADIWTILALPWVAALQADKPSPALHLDILSAAEIVHRLVGATIDIGLMFEPPQSSELASRPLASLPLVLVSAQPGQELETALEHGYVMVDWGHHYRRLHAEQFPRSRAAALRVNLAGQAKELITRLNGSAYLPLALVTDELSDGRLYRVAGAPVFTRTAYLVTRAESDGDPFMGAATELLLELARRLPVPAEVD